MRTYTKSVFLKLLLAAVVLAAAAFVGFSIARALPTADLPTADLPTAETEKNPPSDLSQPSSGAPDASEAPETYTGGFNLLLLGTDISDRRTDTIILARFDRGDGGIRLLSIPRDTRIYTGKSYQKINAVLQISGLDGLVSTVEELTGAKVDYYAVIDFKGFREVIDILGGVRFDVPQRMKYSDPVQNLKIDLQKGEQLLDGYKAEQLCRFRNYPEGDVTRTQVQRDFLAALISQKVTPANIFKAPEIFSVLAENTKTNFTLGSLFTNLGALSQIKGENVESYRMPGSPKYIKGISYYIVDVDKAKELCAQYFAA